MEDKNKLFTNFLVDGFLIFVGVGIIIMITKIVNHFNENSNLNYSTKVESNNKVSNNNSSYKSPSQNFKNPYKECRYSEAKYQMVPQSMSGYLPTSVRICIQDKKIIKVYSDETIYTVGRLDSVIRGIFDQIYEYKLENNKLIRYRCLERGSTRSCNGKTKREVFAIER